MIRSERDVIDDEIIDGCLVFDESACFPELRDKVFIDEIGFGELDADVVFF